MNNFESLNLSHFCIQFYLSLLYIEWLRIVLTSVVGLTEGCMSWVLVVKIGGVTRGVFFNFRKSFLRTVGVQKVNIFRTVIMNKSLV